METGEQLHDEEKYQEGRQHYGERGCERAYDSGGHAVAGAVEDLEPDISGAVDAYGPGGCLRDGNDVGEGPLVEPSVNAHDLCLY